MFVSYVYRQWTKVFGRFQFSLYISYKTSFTKYYLEINSSLILIIVVLYMVVLIESLKVKSVRPCSLYLCMLVNKTLKSVLI